MIAQLQYITGPATGREVLQNITRFCRAGGQWVQLRMKNHSFKEVLEMAIQAKKITNHFNAKLIINDFAEVARTINAYGVHLGKEDMSASEARSYLFDHQIIGSTCNSFEDIQKIAAENESDYIGLGPFRFTKTKEKLSPVLGVEGLEQTCSSCSLNGIDLPIIAVGGIEKEDISTILETGVHGVAASGMLEGEKNLDELVKKMQRMAFKELDYAKFEISE